jgi:nucleoside-diphosphate kinase
MEEYNMVERTLGIIKPDAVKRKLIGKVLQKIEGAGLNIVALKMVNLTKEETKTFYLVHKEKGFYESLTRFMSSGPAVVMVIEGERVVERYRELMGATNFKDAKDGTIRAEFATSIEQNIVHGSDSCENATIEINFFF